MSLVLPVLYHWSPAECRNRIQRHGLRPTCPTAVATGLPMPGGARPVDPEASVLAVCLGTSPSHAWSLSGALWAERGSVWDLWQVSLDHEDAVHPLPTQGNRLDEIRVANRIPKRRIWLVGQREVTTPWSSASRLHPETPSTRP